MKTTFIEALQDRVLLTDGGMGTEIYKRGFFVNRCYDELNLSASKVISDIHKQNAKAGAEVLTTNTFGANRIQLGGFGFTDKLEEINRKGVELAKEIAEEDLYIMGSIGPIPRVLDLPKEKEEVENAFREQAEILQDAGVDVLYLDTFSTIEQLELAYNAIQEIKPSIPIFPSVAFELLSSCSPRDLLERLNAWDIKILGLNEGDAEEMLEMLPHFTKAEEEDLYISVLPSAGLPHRVDGRLLYMASPEYMAEYARRFVQKGARMVGGGAGITPDMIKEMASFLRSVQPRRSVTTITETETKEEEHLLEPVPLEKRTRWGEIIGKKFAVSVELSLPKGLDPSKSLQGAKFLAEQGIDAVNLADGPRASGRMSPTSLALLIQKHEIPIETIIHVCCRDRNLLALQMDLIGANALDLKNLLLITGDPPKMGIYPDATSVFDLDAISLLTSANLMNHGVDFARRPLKGQTEFVLGTGCNPGATDLDLEVERYKQKVEAGAEYIFSQPIYDPTFLDNFLKRIDEEKIKPIPFFVGILPLASLKNAEFLHNNVPGMQVPEEIRKRLEKAPTKDEQRKEGINIAAEALKGANRYPHIKGAYIFPPFGRYDSIIEVLEKSGVW